MFPPPPFFFITSSPSFLGVRIYKLTRTTTIQHALDIEATVRRGGMLNVGVFAPEEMLSLHDGEELVRELKEGVEAL
jgi:hypothetical protein